jgi:CRP-like cAMP-binding protein
MAAALLSYLQLFSPIPEADQQLISNAFQLRSLKEGERIFAHTAEGKELTHFFLKENQFCTILNSFNNQVPAEESIEAACDAEILFIRRDALLELYKQLPYLKELITQIQQQALLDKIRIRNSYLGQDSTMQYKLFLIQQPDIATRVPLSDIASYLGVTPQSLSRIRKNMH